MKQIERRLFAALLVLALCLSLLPATVFAEEAPVVITSLSEITNLSGSYKLADDITVTEPFGSDTERFNGTLDGDGHTVTINITKDGSGMFAALGANAVVKNFVVSSANVKNTGDSYPGGTGAIAGTSKGTISDIRVESIELSGMRNTGGLVGVLESGATLTRCCIDGGTVKKGSTSDTGFGGLVGESSGTVSFSSANVTMDHNDARPNYDYTGGIVGQNDGTITDCYFTGSFIESPNKSDTIGGICGKNNGSIANCHFFSAKELTSGTYKLKAIAYNSYYGSTTNCYYLDTSFSNDSSDGTKKTAAEFASLAETLGENWTDGSDGYPVLTWQTWKYSNTAVKYQVQTYLEDVAGDGYVLSDTAEKKAEPDETVTADASEIEGFTFDAENENNVLSGQASANLVLKLFYKRNSYTLTWDTGDYAISSGDDEYTHGEVKYGAEITYPTVDVVGMSVKWDKTPATMPAEDTTITASYAPAIYDVTWDANGGKLEKSDGWGGTDQVDTIKWSGYGSSGGAVFGATFGQYKWNANSTSFSNRALPVPTHTSMVFDGWYTAAEGGEPITADTAVTAPEGGSFTFYAHWTEGWTVIFDPNGGSVSPKTVLVKKGDAFGSDIPTPTRSGYDFAGWFNGEEKLESTTVISADVTYTAAWTPKTFTLRFNANGGEGTMEPQTFTYGVAQKISKNLFTREGYRFLGWATWSSATEANYADEEEYTIGSYNQTFFAVWEEVRYDLTLTVTPEDATVVLKDASGNPQTGTNNVYNLREGTYTYTASAYGYETATGEIVLTEDTELPITLVKLPTYAVTFEVTKPEGTGETQITVTNADGKVMTADETGAYQLIAGSYHYLVKAQGATKEAADFTVTDEALHFTIELLVRTGWDGETMTEPHQITAEEATGDYAGMTGWYRIETGEELAWFANKVNTVSGGYNANAVLAKDIDLGGELWKPMGNSYSYNFSGTFDGAGHTIRNLYCEGDSYQGLFGYSKGTIRNLTVSGSVTLKLSGMGGYEANAGGIVAYQNNGRIENCASFVTVTNEHGSGRTGGIAAYVNGATIVSSFNAGTLSGGLSIAGIAGYCGGTSTITDCYNIGTIVGGDNIVETTYTFGQIAGIASSLSDYSASKITSCYNAGEIKNVEKYSRIGAIAAARGAAEFEKCYYLEADGLKAIGNGLTDGCTAVDAATLAADTMPANLSEAFKQDTGCGGTYPILTWQILRAHSFTTTASDEVATPATCTEAATYYVKCDNCDAVSETETVTVGAPNGHSFTTAASDVVATPATCTEAATYYVKCDNCDAVSETETVAVGEALGHTLTATPATDATCTTAGNTAYWTCSVCEKLFSDEQGTTETTLEATVIPAAHTDVQHVPAKEPACKQDGNIEYWHCTACGKYYSDAALTTEISEAETVIRGLPHQWSEASYEWTQTEDGYTCTGTTHCTREGCTAEPMTETVTAVYAVVTDATCTEAGEGVYTATFTNNKIAEASKTVSIEAKGHTEVVDAAVAPTCTEAGLTEGSHCSACNEVIVAQQVVAALGHKFENGTCTVCGAADPDYKPETPWVNPFVDVKENDWFYEGVKFAAQHELFNGTSATTFSPDDNMTRAMLVTVLWRLDGKPTPKAAATFTDVPAGQYFSEAVAWAAENGVVNGVGENKFDPNGSVTREQIAAILFRYAQKKGYDVEKRAELTQFPDESKVSTYAKEALSWANAEGLVKGSAQNGKDYLDPQGSATRAQVATILSRFAQNIVK